MISLHPKDCSLSQLQAILTSAVAPRPIALASTIDTEGNPNLSPFSFYNIFSTNPPILIFSPARRVRDNTTKHTLANVKSVAEVVINTVPFSMIHQMSLSSTEYAMGVNEFKKSGLTMLQSDEIRPFRVAESPIQMECKVNEILPLGKQNGAGNLVICEILKIHLSESIYNDEGTISQEKLDLVARGGGSYYIRAKEGFLEIPKPLTTLGVGVDALPEAVRKSTVLTGNDLGILGNIEAVPTTTQMASFWKTNRTLKNKLQNTESKHQLAKDFTEQGMIFEAWCILLS